MQRTSESIGTLAAALAKAQIELVNPDKSMLAAIEASGRAEGQSDLPICTAIERIGYRAQDAWST